MSIRPVEEKPKWVDVDGEVPSGRLKPKESKEETPAERIHKAMIAYGLLVNG